jgi:predicted CXXCH cytochrome family protein
MSRPPLRCLRTALVVVSAAVCLGFLSCMPEERHRVLTFFFDGVPPLHPGEGTAQLSTTNSSGAPATKGGPRAAVSAPEASEHKPGREGTQCGACHDPRSANQLLKPLGQLCNSCHERETHEFHRMHGPVAFGDCAACHEAHRSPYKHLVKAPTPKLCFFCHEHTPAGEKPLGCTRASDEVNCLTCHDPHGGADPVFLVGRGAGAAGKRSPVPSPEEAR